MHQKEPHNFIFKCDNLKGLSVLKQSHKNRVKCIYIDPPYNTGESRKHFFDNFTGSKWKKMMLLRLKALRKLLSEDGSIWISIDDSELGTLRTLCDRVFGKDNFLAVITWQHKINWAGYKGKFELDHTYIVAYSKSNLFHFKNNARPKTVWLESETGGQFEAIQESENLFGKQNVFSTPKPERLIEHILNLTTSEGDLVLDCFAGSGTTGAVAQKLKRHWILFEIGDQCQTHILPRIEKLCSVCSPKEWFNLSSKLKKNHAIFFSDYKKYDLFLKLKTKSKSVAKNLELTNSFN